MENKLWSCPVAADGEDRTSGRECSKINAWVYDGNDWKDETSNPEETIPKENKLEKRKYQ